MKSGDYHLLTITRFTQGLWVLAKIPALKYFVYNKFIKNLHEMVEGLCRFLVTLGKHLLVEKYWLCLVSFPFVSYRKGSS